MDELYLDNIDEYVNDHNKIVTYKWLSLNLGVHVNAAKKMLFHYLEERRRDSSTQLHATYLVSGKVVENGNECHKVSVVREEQLEDAKAKMSVIVSVHVYSIHKTLLKDSGPLYSVDYDAVKENLTNSSRYSAIRCASAVPRTPAEVQQASEKLQAPPPETAPVKPAMNGHASLPAKPAAKQPKGIMGMFANNKPASKKPELDREVKTEQTNDPPAAETSKSKPAAKTNAMTNFFGKPAAKKSEKIVKEVEEAKSSLSVEEKPSSPVSKDTEMEEEETQEVAVDKYISSSKTKRPASSEDEEMDSRKKKTKRPDVSEDEEMESRKKKKSKRFELSDDEEEEMESQKKKKRRRIKKPQPESSDEEVIPDSPRRDSPRVRDPTPSPEVKKEPVSHSKEHNECKSRKRRRVLKAHTFLDDEGCMVTEKVYESESYSETEDQDVVPTAKAAAAPTKFASGKKDKEEKKAPKKASATVKKPTKQASIMGFFVKK